MKSHPLTPRKPEFIVNIICGATGALVFALLLIAMIAVFPPQAWIPHADKPRAANIGFFLALVQEMLSSAHNSGDTLGTVIQYFQLPITFASSIRYFGIHVDVIARLLAAFTVGYLVASDLRLAILTGRLAEPAVTHLRGLRFIAGKAAHKSLFAHWRKRHSHSVAGIELADRLSMPRSMETEHILLVGGTGAGKTTIMEKLMQGAIDRGDQLLALDVKGDLTARFPTEDFSLLALNDNRSATWLLGKDIVSEADAAELAAELISETSDPSWSGGARQVLTALIRYLQDTAKRRGVIWTWRHLDHLLQKPVEKLFDLLKEDHPVAASLIDMEREETRRQAMSFYLVLIANVGQIAHAFAEMGRSSKSVLSINEWAEGNTHQNVILQQSQRQPELSAAMCRIVLKIIADSATSRLFSHGNQPSTWLFLDEMPQIGRTEAIPRLAAIGRSMGIRVVTAIQSPAQLREIYGQEGSQHLLDNLTTKIIGRVAGGSTAAEISSSWIGNRTVSWYEVSGSHPDGRPRSEQRTRDIPVVDAAVLANDLGLHQPPWGPPQIRALVAGHGDIALLSWPVGQWKERRQQSSAR